MAAKIQHPHKNNALQRQLDGLHTLAHALTTEVSLDAYLRLVADLTRELIGAKYVVLFVSCQAVEPRYAFSGPSHLERPVVKFLSDNRILLDNDQFFTNPREHSWHFGIPLGSIPAAKFLGIPIRVRGNIIGGLCLARLYTSPGLSTQAQQYLQTLAAYAAVAVERVQLSRERATAAQSATDAHREVWNVQALIEELETSRPEFVSTIIHDLRAPLANLQGAVELLADRLDGCGQDDTSELLEIIGDQVSRLTRLIEGTLSATRTGTKSVVLPQQNVDLHDHLTAMAREFRIRAPEYQFVLPTEDHMPHVSADPDHLDEILANLLDNAVKFSPPGSRIAIEVQSTDSQATICVRDEGVGISADHLDNIFEKFYQVGSATSEQRGGYGLGLYLVRTLVEAYGGRIWVESTPGNGSCFSFSLPTIAGDRPG